MIISFKGSRVNTYQLSGINELQDPSLLPTIEDPALDHPFSKRLVQTVQAYKELHQKTGKQPPLIKNAG